MSPSISVPVDPVHSALLTVRFMLWMMNGLLVTDRVDLAEDDQHIRVHTLTPDQIARLVQTIPCELADVVAEGLASAKIVIAKGHGTFAGGKDLDQAYLYTSLAEHCCKVLHLKKTYR